MSFLLTEYAREDSNLQLPAPEAGTLSIELRARKRYSYVQQLSSIRLGLFNQHPHRVLTFTSPCNAITDIINQRGIVSLGRLYDKYIEWLEGQFGAHARSSGVSRAQPDECRNSYAQRPASLIADCQSPPGQAGIRRSSCPNGVSGSCRTEVRIKTEA